MTTQIGRRRAVRGAAVAAVAAGLTIGLSSQAALADPGSTAPATPTAPTAAASAAPNAAAPATGPGSSGATANSGVPQFTNVDQVLLYLNEEYNTGSGGGQVSNLIKAVMKLRVAGYRPSKQNAEALIQALDERPNQKALIEALSETLGYQQKIKAQNEMLQQSQAAKNGNSAVMGAGQMPAYGNPAPAAPWPGGGGDTVTPPAGEPTP